MVPRSHPPTQKQTTHERPNLLVWGPTQSHKAEWESGETTGLRGDEDCYFNNEDKIPVPSPRSQTIMFLLKMWQKKIPQMVASYH